ncbi:MAG TPA: GNAT family protein [Mycobacteriales bacterium]|nr:GNAT family protein [Mycobacteriales bacterium]
MSRLDAWGGGWTRAGWVPPLPLPTPDQVTDGVVALRPWRNPGDLPAVRAAAADPAVTTGTTVPAAYTERSGRNWIVRQHARRFAGTGLVLAITGSRSGAAVGMVGLTGVNQDAASCELGYWVVPAARGRGLSGRAAALLVAWAFEALPLVRITARVAVDNVASQRSVERAGLRREGVARASYRIGDGWMDMVSYAAVRPGTPRIRWADLQPAPAAGPSAGSSSSDTELMQ